MDGEMPIMNRERREEARAWAEAARLIRGGVDDVVEMIEYSQNTIEALIDALKETICVHCHSNPIHGPTHCERCGRFRRLLEHLT